MSHIYASWLAILLALLLLVAIGVFAWVRDRSNERPASADWYVPCQWCVHQPVYAPAG